MSVPPGNRSKSGVQFLDTADEIESRAMDICRKWPKSWFFIITNRTLALASQIAEHAQKANAIFPVVTEAECQERVIELQRALGATYAFARKMERAYSKFPICGEKKTPSETSQKSSALLEEMMILCSMEIESLKGNISSTRKTLTQKEK